MTNLLLPWHLFWPDVSPLCYSTAAEISTWAQRPCRNSSSTASTPSWRSSASAAPTRGSITEFGEALDRWGNKELIVDGVRLFLMGIHRWLFQKFPLVYFKTSRRQCVETAAANFKINKWKLKCSFGRVKELISRNFQHGFAPDGSVDLSQQRKSDSGSETGEFWGLRGLRARSGKGMAGLGGCSGSATRGNRSANWRRSSKETWAFGAPCCHWNGFVSKQANYQLITKTIHRISQKRLLSRQHAIVEPLFFI